MSEFSPSGPGEVLTDALVMAPDAAETPRDPVSPRETAVSLPATRRLLLRGAGLAASPSCPSPSRGTSHDRFDVPPSRRCPISDDASPYPPPGPRSRGTNRAQSPITCVLSHPSPSCNACATPRAESIRRCSDITPPGRRSSSVRVPHPATLPRLFLRRGPHERPSSRNRRHRGRSAVDRNGPLGSRKWPCRPPSLTNDMLRASVVYQVADPAVIDYALGARSRTACAPYAPEKRHERGQPSRIRRRTSRRQTRATCTNGRLLEGS